VQPDVCLSGHIHESRALDFVGRTALVNPGMLAQGGYAVIGLAGRSLTVKLRTL
jgi:Icc-related predicted phosphoesterase